MGLIGGIGERFRRFGRRLSESDEGRLAEETLAWASSLPGTTRLSEVTPRTPVRIAGVVERITVQPAEGRRSIEAVISDGTGEVTAAWMGRMSIPGMVLGTRLILQGVVAESRAGRRLVNPAYEFA